MAEVVAMQYGDRLHMQVNENKNAMKRKQKSETKWWQLRLQDLVIHCDSRGRCGVGTRSIGSP